MYINFFPRSKKGFTLVELLVVIAVIAILFAVILIAINPAQRFKDSRNTRRLSDVRSISDSVSTYITDRRGTYPAEIPDNFCIGTKQATDFGATAPTGTRAYWQMTDATDTTGGTNVTANNLTLNGGAATATGGKFGNGLVLNGIRQDATTANQAELQLSSPLTLEAWFRLSKDFDVNRGSPMGLIDKGDYRLSLSQRNGAMTFELNPNTADTVSAAYAGSNRSFTSFVEYNGTLFAGQGGVSAGDGVIYQSNNGTSWSLSSFPASQAQENILSLTVYKGKLYAGRGVDIGDAAIYSYDGTTNDYGLGANGWKNERTFTMRGVYALFVWNGNLYAGTGGLGLGDAEVYEFNGINWRSLNLSTSFANEAVLSLTSWNGELFAATAGANRAQALSWNGTSWSQDYVHASKNYGNTLAVYQRNLYLGIGGSIDTDMEVLMTTNGSVWNVTDNLGAREMRSMVVYDGKLYAGLGGSIPTYRKIRVFDGVTWQPFYADTGADGDDAENIRALYVYQGKLFAAELGDVAGDGDILSFGSTLSLQSAKRTWNANQWYHVAATYDGTNAILYVNGREDARVATSMTMGNQNLPLSVGSDAGDGFFEGTIDNALLYEQAISSSLASDHAGCYNLAQYIVPEYMGKIPDDPSSTVTDGTDTGYTISKTGNTVTISAPLTETTPTVPDVVKASR